MNPTLRFGFGNTLNAVSTAFVFQLFIDVFTLNRENNFLVTACFRKVYVHDSEFKPVVFGIAAVHSVEIAGKDGGLVAASSGADFHNHVFAVRRIGRDQCDHDGFFCGGQFFARLRQFHFGHFLQLII